jgi:hypothetical protein
VQGDVIWGAVAGSVVLDPNQAVRQNIPVNRFRRVVWTVGIGHADKTHQTDTTKQCSPGAFVCPTFQPSLRFYGISIKETPERTGAIAARIFHSH